MNNVFKIVHLNKNNTKNILVFISSKTINMDDVDINELYESEPNNKLFDNIFSEDELRTLCFEMGIDYDSLPGQGKSAKARDLVEYCDRRGRVDELLDRCHRERPGGNWPTHGHLSWKILPA